MQLVIIESPFAGGENIEIETKTPSFVRWRVGLISGNIYANELTVNEVRRKVATLYARAAMRDCLQRKEAPYASHLLYTQPGVLDDDKPDERSLGIEAGLQWGAVASKTVVYTDLGISAGMRQGIERAKAEGRPVEYRSLKGWSNDA